MKVSVSLRGRPRAMNEQPGEVPPMSASAVVVEPALVQIGHGAQTQFTANVEGASAGVTWEVRGLGTVDANGLYTAPAGGAFRAEVVARSTSEPAAIGLAAVDVGP
ncbi:MAG TPA: hypothetical protein VFF36_11055 [Planctomycetota bacterium]|nr:hypothetical protein [Planctomycetota bacterium]